MIPRQIRALAVLGLTPLVVGVALAGPRAVTPTASAVNAPPVQTHVRYLADVTGDKRADLVAFDDAGVWTAAGKPGGGLTRPRLVLAEFGVAQGWTSQDETPRLVGDINGDRLADVVGFGEQGTRWALGQPDGTFELARATLAAFGREQGWTSQDRTPRMLADVNGDRMLDIVAFGEDTTWAALGRKRGVGFAEPRVMSFDLGVASGYTSQEVFPRLVGDVDGDGLADVVAFGRGGVGVAKGRPGSSFGGLGLVLGSAGGGQWPSQNDTPRMLGDVTGDGVDDIVGFGDNGTWVATGQPGGVPALPRQASVHFGWSNGWGTQDGFPRLLADVNNDRRLDVVAFGDHATGTALGQPDGRFVDVTKANPAFAASNGWPSQATTTRLVGDVSGDHRADVVGIGEDGIFLALGKPDGSLGAATRLFGALGTSTP